MPRFRDLTGDRYTRLVVIEFADFSRHGKARWHCECECGASVIVLGASMTSGRQVSCGCYRREVAAETSRTRTLVPPEPRLITYDGRTQSLAAWSRETGVSPQLLSHRLAHWSLERALTTRARPYRRGADPDDIHEATATTQRGVTHGQGP